MIWVEKKNLSHLPVNSQLVFRFWLPLIVLLWTFLCMCMQNIWLHISSEHNSLLESGFFFTKLYFWVIFISYFTLLGAYSFSFPHNGRVLHFDMCIFLVVHVFSSFLNLIMFLFDDVCPRGWFLMASSLTASLLPSWKGPYSAEH